MPPTPLNKSYIHPSQLSSHTYTNRGITNNVARITPKLKFPVASQRIFRDVAYAHVCFAHVPEIRHRKINSVRRCHGRRRARVCAQSKRVCIIIDYPHSTRDDNNNNYYYYSRHHHHRQRLPNETRSTRSCRNPSS